jgi:hypothetical protein
MEVSSDEHFLLLINIPSHRREWQHILSLMSLARRYVVAQPQENILNAILESLVAEMKIFKDLDQTGNLRKTQPNFLYQMDRVDEIRFMYILALISTLTLILPCPTSPTLPIKAEELRPYSDGHAPEFLLFRSAIDDLEGKLSGNLSQKTAETLHSLYEGQVHGHLYEGK